MVLPTVPVFFCLYLTQEVMTDMADSTMTPAESALSQPRTWEVWSNDEASCFAPSLLWQQRNTVRLSLSCEAMAAGNSPELPAVTRSGRVSRAPEKFDLHVRFWLDVISQRRWRTKTRWREREQESQVSRWVQRSWSPERSQHEILRVTRCGGEIRVMLQEVMSWWMSDVSLLPMNTHSIKATGKREQGQVRLVWKNTTWEQKQDKTRQTRHRAWR